MNTLQIRLEEYEEAKLMILASQDDLEIQKEAIWFEVEQPKFAQIKAGKKFIKNPFCQNLLAEFDY